MARMLTVGWEWNHLQAADGPWTTSGSVGLPATSTSGVRTGTYGLRSVNPNGAFIHWAFTGALGTAYFARVYFRTSSTSPGKNCRVFGFRNAAGTTGVARVEQNTSGQLILLNGPGTTVYTSSALTTNQWYRLELKVLVASSPTTGNGTIEFLIDGTSVFATTTGDAGTVAPGQFGPLGETAGGGAATVTMDWDDIAINNNSGADQNSFPGVGEIRLLTPVAAGTAGTNEANWTKPGGSTTNKQTSVDNKPPVYAADSTAAGSAENFLRNATSASSDVTLTVINYTTAGIGASDTITLVVPMAGIGNSNTTAKGGTLGMPSNPTIAQATAAFPTTGAASTTATTWPTVYGTVTYAPSVTKGTQPEIRLNRSTGTGTALVNALGVIVESIPVVTADIPYVAMAPRIAQ